MKMQSLVSKSFSLLSTDLTFGISVGLSVSFSLIAGENRCNLPLKWPLLYVCFVFQTTFRVLLFSPRSLVDFGRKVSQRVHIAEEFMDVNSSGGDRRVSAR